MFKKRAQSALEFLTTYGWAFMVILIMIGALAYFGVLDPNKYLPDKCMVTAGFSCPEVIATSGVLADAVQIRLMNGVGKNVEIVQNPTYSIYGSSNCTAVTATLGGSALTANVSWDQSAESTMAFTCDNALIEGERVTVGVKGFYRPSGSTFEKPFEVTVQAKAN